MKKILSSLLLTSAAIMFYGQAQSLVTENFNALTNGNLATDPTGATAGQNSWYIYQGLAADYQIVAIDASHGKSLNITTGAGAPPASGANTNSKFAYKSITTTATATNNLVRATMEIHTGSATGKGTVGLSLFSSTALIGGIFYDYETKKIIGQARVKVVANPTQIGTLAVSLGSETFPANSWVTVTYIYNKTTGQHSYQYKNNTVNSNYSYGGSTTYAVFSGDVAAEFDAVNTTLANNTVANTAGVDNIQVEFTNTATLGLDTPSKEAKAYLMISPNPTTDVLNIKTDSKINSVSVIDLTGRKVNVRLNSNKVDVASLPAGTYIINIETQDGITTAKFIKK
ncbi:T9SS type A sorting domain-containing protein [Chryseobacterium indoltheticum]|uniref:T9SS type A sorting domain-containing protein n=1 Tax=Chryseobacterium indoltheticum TaxID=254 RepID=UPI0040411D1B